MKQSFLEVKDATKTYKTGAIEVNAVDKLSFSVDEGEFVVIAGPSGAGKTTVLNLLGGMDTLTSGEIVVDGKRLSGLKPSRLTLYRRNDVGFVFQFYNLMPNLTAIENIELAAEICKDAFSPAEILDKVNLSNRAGNFPSQLSGGERQRVSIARAIAKNPKLLLCDEPTGALDYATGKSVLKLLRDLCKNHSKTVIVVTHNGALKDMADKVISIKNGKAVSVVKNENPLSIEEIEW
ncbi:MAG: ABC transporter ATP-binding protein [Clostridiales bacterium]|jgi:putative ABC transport system ATP-binding protein|nr:ABC transporter ATP-binding protein [Clostridiales bacterium]